MLADHRKVLPIRLKETVNKHYRVFFEKVATLEWENREVTRIGHYDYSVEGLTELQSFFRKKKQANCLKAFNAIKWSHLQKLVEPSSSAN